jgi:hypothetical protein
MARQNLVPDLLPSFSLHRFSSSRSNSDREGSGKNIRVLASHKAAAFPKFEKEHRTSLDAEVRRRTSSRANLTTNEIQLLPSNGSIEKQSSLSCKTRVGYISARIIQLGYIYPTGCDGAARVQYATWEGNVGQHN